MTRDPGESSIEHAWDVLETGDAEGAARLALERLERHPDDVAWLHLVGSALQDLGRSGESIAPLERALDLDPSHRPAREALAAALFERCRLDDCEREIERLLEHDADDAYALYLRGLVRELQGHFDEADACLARATRSDPEMFPPRVSLSPDRFDDAVRTALDALPSPFRERIGDLPIVVEEAPTPALLMGPDPLSPDLLGLFVGVPMTEFSTSDPTPIPKAVYLFKRNIERASSDERGLIDEIRITLLHEIGHYLGMDEDDLDDAGFA